MTPQAWWGLALGAVIGAAYGALQRRGLGKGPHPNAVGRSVAGSAVRLIVLMLAVLAIFRFTDADRVFLVAGTMVSYGLTFVVMVWGALWRKSGKS